MWAAAQAHAKTVAPLLRGCGNATTMPLSRAPNLSPPLPALLTSRLMLPERIHKRPGDQAEHGPHDGHAVQGPLQQTHDVQVPGNRGNRGGVLARWHVVILHRGSQALVGTRCQEMLAHGLVALVGGVNEWRPPVVVGQVHVGAALDQQLDQLLIPLLRRHQQRTVTLVVGCVNVCARLQQQLHQLHVPVVRSIVEGGPAVVVRGIHVGAGLDQQQD
mmetsp:Transcript_32631/g.58416  ORF Transcript_32631/g.58416 Transcript_32631/m.58416 type:complete len:217 (-) Transcript_32631:421-1071(-)